MGRSPCCSKIGLRRGPWSTKEDTLLTNYIQQHGEGQWRALPKNAGLLRCGKSCRLRWMNYLRPGIKRGNISQDEEDLIVRLHKLLGNRWSLIAGRLPGRTDNEIKNYWNTYLLKKLKTSGITPPTKSSTPTKIKKKSTTLKPKNNNKKSIKKNKKNNVVETISSSKLVVEEEEHNNIIITNHQENNHDDDVPKNKILYVPKAIRVSSSFTRSNSYDSLVSGGSSNSSTGGGTGVDVLMPLFEIDKEEVHEQEEEEMNYDFLSGDCDLLQPVLQHHHHHHQQHFTDLLSTDVNMWEKVYDEYLQLL